MIATDVAGNVSTGQAVTLAVNDLDEVAPSITSGATATAIDENSGADQVIYTAAADDSADISGGVSFSLATGSDAALSIDADTGAVTLSDDPDHETQAAYSFTVIATDAAGNASEGQAVTLAVNDLDEVAPSITSGATATAIDENAGANQVIYTATADDTSDISGGVSFSLATGSDAALSIDADTGAVTLSDDPDHETQAAYSFTVIATDAAGNASEGQAVTLAVNDLDEVAPSITSGATATAIDENAGANQVIYTATADDTSDISGGVSFSLATGSDAALSIDADTGAVTLSTDPDHETQAAYSFTVIATDAAGNASEGQAVTLAVNDLDDSAPSITSGATAAAIDENSGAGQVIYTATADDSADISGGVSFSLEQGSDAALSINADTGAVTLSSDPDHETQAAYSFTVIATDAAGNVGEQAVTLGIKDLDEVAPSITSGATATAIDEDSGADQIIYTATADDSADISGGVSFSLAQGSDAALSINADTGAVTLSTDPDQETQAAYSFTIVATDAAGNISTSQAVTLSVNDLDEVAPTVTSGATATSIDENAGVNQVIYTATADDSGDISGGVSFSLAQGSDAALSINADTGAVTLSTDPDHETQAAYSFTVAATDAAGNASEGQAVTLAVNDLDDAAPTLTSGAVATAIDENSGAGQVIYTATADDSADISGGFSFSLATGSDAALSINADTGAVTLSTDPDHETLSSYSFTVVATDAAGNASEQAVTLGINDLDEVAPTITSSAIGLVVEDSGANRVVYTATSDDSADVSGGVTYSLADGSDDALSIDSTSGAVTLSENPSKDVQAVYSFTVIATDSVGLSSSLTVNLTVDVAPLITSSTTPSVSENIESGQVVYTVVASDSEDPDAIISYDLKEGSDENLSIDTVTGQVTLGVAPDFENQESFVFIATASDQAGNTSEQLITLAVTNLDEVAPSITSGAVATAINENSGANQVVYTTTSDDTADASDGVTYSLTDGSDAGLSINSQTGAVSLATNPDHETKPSYSFTVVATDAAGNASEQTVTLGISDLDEVAPTITSSASASVPILQTSLYQISAVDTADISGGLTFGVKADAGDDDLVDVNSETGQVSLKSGFTDDEEKNAYTFTVLVSDGVNASTEQVVTVNVASPIAVAGPSVTRGGLTPSLTTDDDGADVLEIRLDALLVSSYPDGIENLDFLLNYSTDELGVIVDSQIELPGAFGVPNATVAGIIEVSALYFPTALDAEAVLMRVTFTQPEDVATTTIELKDVLVGSSDLSPSLYVFGDSVVVAGTSASEFFDLEGGDATVTGGVGPDVFSLTATTGSLTTINDFVSGEDTIDLSDLAEAYGYGSGVSGDASPADGVLSRYAGDTTSISELIAGNDDSLDNTFGAFFNNETDKLTVFMDSSTASGSTTIETFVITLPEDVSFEDSDLTAVSYSFIA